jgi:hypothetical protein
MAPPDSRKRRASAPPDGPSKQPPVKATFKRTTKPLTATEMANAKKNKRREESQQVALPFDSVERFMPGLKVLLPETIYDRPEDVSVVVVVFL